MSREKRLPDGLTARERIFAELMCKGMRPRDAYRQAGLGARATDKQINEHSLVKARQPHIVGHMASWLRNARIGDIDSAGQAVHATLEAISEAKDDRNWTAIAALLRLRYQHNGIAEKTTISIEAVISDDDLLRRIVGDDVEKLGSLKSLLIGQTFSHGEKPLLIEGTADEE